MTSGAVIRMAEVTEPLALRIYLVRGLLSEALKLAGDGFPFSRMRAILSADHAVELLLYNAASRVGCYSFSR
ncbi:MAG: hypothetical protein HY675_26670 [Chloroflexi bacterium]|nr:hypothetical protein [Chloroflexota bacterium]